MKNIIVEIVEYMFGKQSDDIAEWLSNCELICADIGDVLVKSSLVSKIPSCAAFFSIIEQPVVKIENARTEPEKTILPDKHENRNRAEQLCFF